MGVHVRSWEGVGAIILDTRPLEAMRVEQCFAAASPANEVRFDSFESYSDALAHCRERRDVGLIILSDELGDFPVGDVFRNLAEVYEDATGWPALGVLYFREAQSPSALSAMVAQRNIREYIPMNSILNASLARLQMVSLWDAFTATAHDRLFPTQIAGLLRDVAAHVGLGRKSQVFQNRTTNVLCQSLNLSWLDRLALEWVHVVRKIEGSASAFVLNSLERQRNVAMVASFDGIDSSDLSAICLRNASLAARVGCLVDRLDVLRLCGSLEAGLRALVRDALPGKPALLRCMARNVDNILAISTEVDVELPKTSAMGKVS